MKKRGILFYRNNSKTLLLQKEDFSMKEKIFLRLCNEFNEFVEISIILLTISGCIYQYYQILNIFDFSFLSLIIISSTTLFFDILNRKVEEKEVYKRKKTQDKIVLFLFSQIIFIIYILFYCYYTIIQKIFIIKKDYKNQKIKINLNNQEYLYKAGKLHTESDQIPAIIKYKGEYGFLGDFYYKGFFWSECTSKLNFEKFKKYIDMKEKLDSFEVKK